MREPLPFDEDEWIREGEYRTAFSQQQTPNWINVSTTGGGSVTYSSNQFGRANIATGTTATGDGATLTFGDGSAAVQINNDRCDMLVLSGLIETSSLSGVTIEFGFERNADNRVVADLVNNTLDTNSTNPVNTARMGLDVDYLPVHVVWDILNERAYAYIAGYKSPEIPSSEMPAVGYTYDVLMPRVRTTDTTTDKTVRVRALSLKSYLYW